MTLPNVRKRLVARLSLAADEAKAAAAQTAEHLEAVQRVLQSR